MTGSSQLRRVLILAVLLAATRSARAADPPAALRPLIARGWDDLGRGVRGAYRLRCPTDGAVMVWVPGGERLPDGLVLHPVVGARRRRLGGYLIDRTEVSWQRYARFCEATGRTAPARPAGMGPDPKLPVVNVSVDDALDYALWADKSLPGVAEWRRASGVASGLTHGLSTELEADLPPWPWGHQPIVSRGVARDNLAGAADGFARWASVDSCPAGASSVGCLHLAGNVGEWVAAPQAPDGPEGWRKRAMILGGDWRVDPRERDRTRSWRASRVSDGAGRPTVGFRTVRPVGLAPLTPAATAGIGFAIDLARFRAVSLAWSPRGGRIAFCGYEPGAARTDRARLALYDLERRTVTRWLGGHAGEVDHVAFTAGGRRLLSGGRVDGKLKLWDVETGRAVRVLEVGAPVISVAASPDGHWLAAAIAGEVRVWGPDADRPRRLTGYQAWQPGSLAFSPDGRMLAVCASRQRTVTIWDVPTARPLRRLTLPHPPGSLAFSPSGDRLAIAARELWVYETRGWRWTLQLRASRGAQGCQSVAWRADGRTLLCGGDRTWLRDARTGALRYTLYAQPGDVTQLAGSPDGRWLVTRTQRGPVAWDLAHIEQRLRPHRSRPDETALTARDLKLVDASLVRLAAASAAERRAGANDLQRLDRVPDRAASRVLAALARAAGDAEARVRGAALSALQAQLASLRHGREAAIVALAVRSLRDVDVRVVRTACELLLTGEARSDPPLVAGLIHVLDGADWGNRRRAAQALEGLGAEAAAAAPALLRALEAAMGHPGHDPSLLRVHAARALGRLAPAAALTHAERRVQGGDPRTAEALLGGMGLPAVQPLIAWLARPARRSLAVRCLGRIGAPARAATPQLLERLLTADRALSDDLLHALERIQPDPAVHLDRLLAVLDGARALRVRRALAGHLARAGDAARPALTARLDHADPDVRRWVVDALGGVVRARVAWAVDLLIRAAADGQADIRCAAAGHLGRAGELASPAVSGLIALLEDRDAQVQAVALDVLVRLHGPLRTDPTGAAPRIAAAVGPRLLAGAGGEVRHRPQALWRIRMLGADGLPLLDVLLADGDATVRRVATTAVVGLAFTGVPRRLLVPRLLQATRDAEPGTRRSAVIAFVRFRTEAAPAVPRLIELLDDPDTEVGRAARVSLTSLATHLAGRPEAGPIAAALGARPRR